ncbi:MAG: glycosyltransferase [Flavipsychrobacter sp.]|nr:glycosyltransferase [Flavipsychrobacter sp.]
MVKKAKKLLFAPLDWGMGHTTRSIPLIRYLQSIGHHITFAGNDSQCALIKENLQVETIYLEGYNITYSKRGSTFSAHLLLQVPKILLAIKKEKQWLDSLLSIRQFDGIVSDNRYGMYYAGIPSVIMTHQLRIQTGWGNLADSLLQYLHYRFLNRFSERWIVDVPGNGLAGQLSHPAHIPSYSYYIGLLSQLRKPENAAEGSALLILLSGPEPQRTILADLLWKQTHKHTGKVIFIEGNAGKTRKEIPAHITWYAQVNNAMLQQLAEQAAMVICRSGYSTIMDIIRLNKKAILIPTPGQTEQEYLGNYLYSKNLFFTTPQKGFNIDDALGAVTEFPFNRIINDTEFSQFVPVIDRWLSGF